MYHRRACHIAVEGNVEVDITQRAITLRGTNGRAFVMHDRDQNAIHVRAPRVDSVQVPSTQYATESSKFNITLGGDGVTLTMRRQTPGGAQDVLLFGTVAIINASIDCACQAIGMSPVQRERGRVPGEVKLSHSLTSMADTSYDISECQRVSSVKVSRAASVRINVAALRASDGEAHRIDLEAASRSSITLVQDSASTTQHHADSNTDQHPVSVPFSVLSMHASSGAHIDGGDLAMARELQAKAYSGAHIERIRALQSANLHTDSTGIVRLTAAHDTRIIAGSQATSAAALYFSADF